MNGVTGRMGYRQHLVRSLLAIRERAACRCATAPALARAGPGRPQRGQAARRSPTGTGSTEWTTDLDAALARAGRRRSTSTPRSPAQREKAIRPGDRRRQAHLHREADRRRRWTAPSSWPAPPTRPASSTAWCRTSSSCPACASSKRLVDGGFFGRILSVRGEFGYWVFEGDWQAAQRPSLELPGRGRRRHRRRHVPALAVRAGASSSAGSRAVTAHVATHIPQRWDEHGEPYDGHRRRRRVRHLRAGRRRRRADQLLLGGAGQPRRAGRVPGRRHRGQRRRRAAQLPGPAPRRPPRSRCGTRTCRPPSASATSGRRCRTTRSSTTASRRSGSCSCGTSSTDAPYTWDLLAGARGVQLAELGLRSAREGRRIEVPELAP